MRNTTFLGCGSANMFAIMYLLDNGFQGDILVVDAGKNPYDRTRKGKDLIYGFAGAGLWSDGKMVFSPHQDLTAVTDTDKYDCHRIIKSMVSRFTDSFHDVGGISAPVTEDKLKDKVFLSEGMSLLQSTVIHLGTDNNVAFGKKVYDYLVSAGVRFLWEVSVINIDLDRKVMVLEDGTLMDYDLLQIGVGKTGVKLINRVAKDHNLSMNPGALNIGCRFEMDYTPEVDWIARNIQYDFKFFKRYSDAISLRTFCVNNWSAHIVEEFIGDQKTFNGHAYGYSCDEIRVSNKTNFGIIARVFGMDTYREQERILARFPKSGLHVRSGKMESTLSSCGDEVGIHELDGLFGILGISDMYKDFIHLLDKSLKHGDRYVMYLPEIKMTTGILSTNKNYVIMDPRNSSLRYPDVSWVGDNSSGAVGIVPSAVTGIMGVKRIV